MIHILIDTCSWDDLIIEPESSLAYLENLVRGDSLTLVITTTVLREWNSGKEKVKEKYFKNLKTKYRAANEVNQIESWDISYDIQSIKNPFENLIKRFDKLMDSGLIIDPSLEVRAYCSGKAEFKKAPFHSKNSSMSDALIIYSFLDYFKDKEGQELMFISKNHSDFADPKETARTIHPEIIEDFENVNLNYFCHINQAIHELKRIYPANSFLPISSSMQVQISDEILIDSEQSLFDQFYEYFKERFSEFKYVPNHILLKNTPFKSNPKSSYPYYSNYTLFLDNFETYQLFKEIGASEEGELRENEYRFGDNEKTKKAKFILRCLTNNLVFFIAYNKDRSNYINVGFVDSPNCNCSKCRFRRFEFADFFKGLVEYDDTTEGLIELAYLQFLIGNYINSSELFFKALRNAKSERKFGLVFIIEYNLTMLKNFILYNFYGRKSSPEILQKIENIQLGKALVSPNFLEHKALVNWIFKEKFYSSSMNEITNLTSKIIEQYHSALRGGYSSNNHIGNSINSFQELTYFLDKNKIIYDRFTEFFQLSEIFFEGVIASYATKEPGHNKLTVFDDWLLTALIRYGKTDHLLKILKRYKVELIKIDSDFTLEGSFSIKALNFISCDSSFKNEIETHCSDNGIVFKDLVDGVFSNILLIMAFGDFGRAFIGDFVCKLTEFIKLETFINWYKIKYLKFFIVKKGNQISAKNLRNLFKTLLTIPKFHEEGVLESISEELESRSLTISFNNKEFKIVSGLSVNQCELCERVHSIDIITSVFKILKDESRKTHIRNLIYESLSKKFDFNLFYNVCIFDIIKFKEVYLDLSLEYCYPKNTIKKSVGLFKEVDYYVHSPLNELLNICFQKEVNLTEMRFEKILKLNKYYEWLILMDEFDYTYFEPIWITKYATKFYYRRIAASSKTKTSVKNYMKDTMDSHIENYYLNIYIRRKWQY